MEIKIANWNFQTVYIILKVYLLNDEGKIKSLRQSWELAKNRLVTNSFLKEEAVCVCKLLCGSTD